METALIFISSKKVYRTAIIKYMTRWTCIVNFMPLVVVPILFYNNMEPHVFYIVLIIAKFIIFEIVLLNAEKFCRFRQLVFILRVIIPSFVFACIFCEIFYLLSTVFDYQKPLFLLLHLVGYGILFLVSMSVYLNKSEKAIIDSLFCKIWSRRWKKRK